MGTNALLIKRLGHEDVQTTLGTYGHLYPSSSTEIANELKGIVNVEFTNNQNMASEVTNQFTKKVKIKCDKSVITQKNPILRGLRVVYYSHSTVAGGFEVISYTIRFTCATSFTMRTEIFVKHPKGYGQSQRSCRR